MRRARAPPPRRGAARAPFIRCAGRGPGGGRARNRAAAAAPDRRRAAARRRPRGAPPPPLPGPVGKRNPRPARGAPGRYFLDLSETETAAALGIARGTVKSRTHRALARLQEELR